MARGSFTKEEELFDKLLKAEFQRFRDTVLIEYGRLISHVKSSTAEFPKNGTSELRDRTVSDESLNEASPASARHITEEEKGAGENHESDAHDSTWDARRTSGTSEYSIQAPPSDMERQQSPGDRPAPLPGFFEGGDAAALAPRPLNKPGTLELGQSRMQTHRALGNRSHSVMSVVSNFSNTSSVWDINGDEEQYGDLESVYDKVAMPPVGEKTLQLPQKKTRKKDKKKSLLGVSRTAATKIPKSSLSGPNSRPSVLLTLGIIPGAPRHAAAAPESILEDDEEEEEELRLKYNSAPLPTREHGEARDQLNSGPGDTVAPHEQPSGTSRQSSILKGEASTPARKSVSYAPATEISVIPEASDSRHGSMASLESFHSANSPPIEVFEKEEIGVEIFLPLQQWATMKSSKTTNFSQAKTMALHEVMMSHQKRSRIMQENRFVIEPTSTARICWDSVALFFVLYDLIVVPYELAGGKLIDTFHDVIVWGGRFFWSLDMCLGFFTGYELEDGSVQKDLRSTVTHHLKREFIFDAALVSINWAEIWSDSVIIQVLTLLRLLRLLKLQAALNLLKNKIESEVAVLSIDVLQNMLAMCAAVHVTACFWLGIGRTDKGWIHFVDFGDEGLLYAYAFNWALTQFHGSTDIVPHTDTERIFQCAALLLAFFAVTAFVSDVTSSMTKLHMLSGKQNLHLRVLRKFLLHRGISGQLSARVQENALQSLKSHQLDVPENEVELLNLVSEPLRVDIHFEIMCPHLCLHPLIESFLEDDPMLMRVLCHSGAELVTVSSGDILFSRGEVPRSPKIIFVVNGSMSYTVDGDEYLDLEKGSWITEHVLWTNWIYHGLLTASTSCSLAFVDAAHFMEASSNSQLLQVNLASYAKCFMEHLNRQTSDERSDYMSRDQVVEVLQTAAPGWKSRKGRRGLGAQSKSIYNQFSGSGKRQGE